jgi:hypothetical protein
LSWRPSPKWDDRIFDISRYVFSFPVFLLATLFHLVPYLVSEGYARRVEDKQFVSSVRFVASFVMYLIWYLLILVLPFSILLKVVILITMPVLGVISYDYWDSLKKAKQKINYLRWKRRKSPVLEQASQLHAEVLQWITDRCA